MSHDRKCAICNTVFQPRSYRQKMCSDKCRQDWKKKYTADLIESGYFLKYQRKNSKVINDRNNARYDAKIGRKNGMLPARKCKRCGTSFVPKYNSRKFCNHACSSKYWYEKLKHLKKKDPAKHQKTKN